LRDALGEGFGEWRLAVEAGADRGAALRQWIKLALRQCGFLPARLDHWRTSMFEILH
jgi:hypothetical protein